MTAMLGNILKVGRAFSFKGLCFPTLAFILFYSIQAALAAPYDTKEKAKQIQTSFKLCNEAIERGILMQEIKDGWAAKFWYEEKLFIIAPRQDNFYCAAFAYK